MVRTWQKMVKKWSRNCPKTGPTMVHTWPKNGPTNCPRMVRQIVQAWSKHGPNMVQTLPNNVPKHGQKMVPKCNMVRQWPQHWPQKWSKYVPTCSKHGPKHAPNVIEERAGTTVSGWHIGLRASPGIESIAQELGNGTECAISTLDFDFVDDEPEEKGSLGGGLRDK